MHIRRPGSRPPVMGPHVTHQRLATLVVALGFLGCSSDQAPTGPAPPVVARIVITPDQSSVAVACSVKLSAEALDATGTPIPQADVEWSTSDASRATVEPGGHVWGRAPGVVTVTAKLVGGTVSRSATATVIPFLGTITGEKIVFNTMRDGNFEIYLMNPDGTDLVNLTHSPKDDFQPVWSPQGDRIAFVSDRSGNHEVYVMHADGTQLRQVTTWDDADLFPSWSGTKIAIERWDDGPDFLDIWVMNDDGTGQRNVTNNPDFARRPSLSPDGARIVFQSDRDYETNPVEIEPEIYVMDADGGNPTNLSNADDAGDQFPEWSPDGTRIAFSSDRGSPNVFGIYVMDADGSNVMRVMTSSLQEWFASWSPDGGELIVGASTRTECPMAPCPSANTDIYRVRLDGTGLTRLTDHPAFDAWADWRPSTISSPGCTPRT